MLILPGGHLTIVGTAMKTNDFAYIRATLDKAAWLRAEAERLHARTKVLVLALQELEVKVCFTPRPAVERAIRLRAARN